MSDEQVCIICGNGATPNSHLINNPSMINELLDACTERLSLGDISISPLTERLSSLSEPETKCLLYHSECRKPLVNKAHIDRLKRKHERADSPTVHRPGRPSTSTECTRPKRTKTIPKAEACLFSTCSFCPQDSTEPLHRVFSDSMGDKLLEIKLNTSDDHVRTCVTDLHVSGDASALEKHYHTNCLQYAQRTCSKLACSNSNLIRSLCDEEIIVSVQNTLIDDTVSLSMAIVNDTYLSILNRYQVQLNKTQNYRKYLKQLIGDRLPFVRFVKSLRKNEPESIVLDTAVSKALEVRSTMFDGSNTVSQVKSMASLLRDEIKEHRDWSYKGSFEDFENPPLLQFFLTHLLYGSHVHTISGKRNDEVDKSVDVACQFIVQNTRSTRQVKHKPKKDQGFRKTVQTPLSIGLPLAIHSRVRNKNLVNTLSEVYIGCDYKVMLDLEKRVEQGVLQRMKETDGFCLPDFIKKGVNIWFAIDNIDLLEDTPTGQNTFHGTVAVINQRSINGNPLNEPLQIPEKLLSPAPVFLVNYLPEPIIKNNPIKFETVELGKRQNLTTNDLGTWALANYLGADESRVNEDETITSQVQESEQVGECNSGSILSVTPGRTKASHKLAKEEVMPTWAATKSLLLTQSTQPCTKTNTEVVAPLFKTSPTDYGTLYTVLMLTQGISAVVVGPERRTVITLDLDLYNRALRIQQSVGNTNWILRAGALHIVFALLHALGKTVDGSGIDICAVESGIYTSAALRGIYAGKAYKRGIEYHVTTSLALMMMRIDDATSEHGSIQPLRAKCASLRKALHERSPDSVAMYDDIQSWYKENLKPDEVDERNGELATFLLQYLEQVESLLQLVNACRSCDWEHYLAALENNIKYFFARDLLNYARLMPVHLAQMNALEQEDPTTWEALKTGDFVVAKSEIPFTHLFTDQALEQEIKELKRHGGIVGLSQDDAALDRLVTTTPHLARIVKQYLDSFPGDSTTPDRSEHYQLSGDVAVRTRENALKLRGSIEVHCDGNPFSLKLPLKNIASSALVPDNMKQDILDYAARGQKRFEEFVQKRLLPTSTVSIWDSMQKLKLKMFSNWMEKTKVRVGDKVIKLREERELLGRFLIIQGSRPELVPKLEETIGEFEMSVIPRSLCVVDGSLHIPTDKASLLHAIEDAKLPQPPQPPQPSQTSDAAIRETQSRVLIVDAMAVLQSMKKTHSMKKLSDLEEAFVTRVDRMMEGYDEGRVVFDRYLDQSLKDKTRQKRATSCTEFAVHPEMKLTMSLKDLLSASSTKSKLTSILAQDLMAHFEGKGAFKFVVVHGNKIQSHGCEETHTHEEADTMIPNQVLACVAENPCREVCVWSPDTDVLTILMDLTSRHLGPQTCLRFLTGKGSKYREIDVVKQVHVLGTQKSQGLIGLHNFSGADWGGKFIGISKKTWVSAYLKLDDDNHVINCFRELGEGPLDKVELTDNELPQQVRALEQFVCHVYCSTGPATLPALRWELFRSKNLEGEMLPPTRGALLPHIARANYISMRDKSYPTNCPDLPPIEENGWYVKDGLYLPVKCLNLPAPRAVIELTKCGCKAGCKESRWCICLRNCLPCTPLCKCYAASCDNVERNETHEDDDEE